jgi:pyruvate/2-oxoglutarate/acetoin dehydrogenase E1 component
MNGIKRIEGCNFDSQNNEVLLFTSKEMIHARFSTINDSLNIVDTQSIDFPKIYARVDKMGRLLTVDKATNNLSVVNLTDGKVVKKYPGNHEEPYSKNFKISKN